MAGCLIPPLLPLRVVWGNVINFLATVSAWRIHFFGFPKNRPRWQKTKHSYLSPEVLLRYQRKLGDLALEKQIVAPSVLAELLREAKEKRRKNRGSFNQRRSYFSRRTELNFGRGSEKWLYRAG